MPVDDYNNYGNPACYYHDAGCCDYNDPAGNHDGGSCDYYYNNGCCDNDDYSRDYYYDNDNDGGKFLR